MNDGLLPIGSIVELDNKKIVMIYGYFGDCGEKSYNVLPYPCSLDNCVSINNSNIKTIKELRTKYDWFTNQSSISSNSITRVLFYGYRDESFSELTNKISDLFN